MSLGENIKRRRLEMNLSQQDLADALGYKTRSSIAKIEKDQTSIPHEKLLSLANALQTSIDYLLCGSQISGEYNSGFLIEHNEKNIEPQPLLNRRKCVAVILAGGSRRVNRFNIPFQFVTVKEKPIVLYTMETFQRHPQIDEMYVVCLNGWEEYLPTYAQKYGISKLAGIIPAGETGIKSVKNAVEWLTKTYSALDIIVLQEGTRPFVDPETISNAIRCCKQYGNAIVVERMDGTTPFLLNESGSGLTHLPSSRLINVQSPEVYTFGTLRQAFLEAAAVHHPLSETICAVFLHNMGRELVCCEGSHDNLRIVHEEDIKLLDALV